MLRKVSQSGTSSRPRSPSRILCMALFRRILASGCLCYCDIPRRTGTHAKLHLAVPQARFPRLEESMTTFKEMIGRVRSQIREISPADARARAGEAGGIDGGQAHARGQ